MPSPDLYLDYLSGDLSAGAPIIGPTGPAGIVWRGTWSAVTTYIVNDGVTNGGESFRSKQAANLNHTPPAGASDAWWELLAQKGTNGTNGAVGPAPIFRGAWVTATAYLLDDVVTDGGGSWAALSAHTSAGGNRPPTLPTVSNATWQLVAKDGATGATGAPGTLPEGTSFTGAHLLDDLFYRTDLRALFVCTVAGTPGTWVQVSVGSWSANPGSPISDLRIWRSDLSTGYVYNGSVWLRQDPYVWGPSIEAKPTASQILLRQVGFVGNIRTTGHSAKAGVAATAQADFLLKKNGTTFLTLRFAAAGTTTTIVSPTLTAFTATDVLTLVAPAGVDATLAQIAFNIILDQQ